MTRSLHRAPALAALVLLSACDAPRPGTAASPRPGFRPPRLVILYATCTVNKDFLSPYNEAVSYTPNLARFAGRSTVFTQHVTEAGQSGPAFASIFTGQHAYRHGVYFHPTKLSDDQVLIAEAYAGSGYETFFWNGHPMASPRLNYGQGVDPENTFEHLLQGEDPRFIRILERLSEDQDYRAFIVTNFSVTHGPYELGNLARFSGLYPAETGGLGAEEIRKTYKIYTDHRLQLQWNFPETVDRLGLSAADVATLARVVELVYKSRIHFLDDLFGGLTGQLGRHQLLDQSLIAFTADHGEVLYREHSPFKWVHGLVLAPEALNVPLIVHSPAVGTAGSTWNEVTRSIDLFPTMLGLSGLAMPASNEVEGVDLSPALLGRETAPPLLAYSHTTPPKEAPEWTLRSSLFPPRETEGIWSAEMIWTAVRDGDDFYRLRAFGDGDWGFELFDLERDPTAARNLFVAENPRHRKMARNLRVYKSLLVKSFLVDPASRLAADEEASILRSLGYIQ